ncbi:FAD-dependent monooxygenase [Mycobacterium sp. pW049]|uniref:FAD-dependent monooxygenase n=1 Tax=[Mycobacterium] bulgaricum TaxID=3238985 RepID=UPI00351ABA56
MDILVSGAGIAGLACALELGTRGHAVTVVESAPHLRTAGTPIDIRGDAIGIAEKMGLLASIEARRIRMSEQTQFVDSSGEPVAALPVTEIGDSDDDIELLREDLLHILAGAVPDSVTVRFGDSIRALSEDGAAQLSSGHTGHYDVVIGADGQHSAVRRMVFGPDSRYTKHLGVYFALARTPVRRTPWGPMRSTTFPTEWQACSTMGAKPSSSFNSVPSL